MGVLLASTDDDRNLASGGTETQAEVTKQLKTNFTFVPALASYNSLAA
jgi:hypothetical protein